MYLSFWNGAWKWNGSDITLKRSSYSRHDNCPYTPSPLGIFVPHLKLKGYPLIIYEGPMGWSVWHGTYALTRRFVTISTVKSGHRLLIFFNGQIIFAEKSRRSRVADSIVRSGEPFKAIRVMLGSHAMLGVSLLFKVLIAVELRTRIEQWLKFIVVVSCLV